MTPPAMTFKNQTQDTWNHESPLAELRKINPNYPVITKGKLVDNTLTGRLKKGCRVTMKTILPPIMVLLVSVASANETTIPLAGSWRFELDAENAGLDAQWHSRRLEDTISLPGTTDQAKKGPGREESPTDRLARPWAWVGPARYQREVAIPESWKGKRVTLFLERTKNSRVWVDGVLCGREDTLSAPHIFDVTEAARPGKRTITVLVDNSKLPPVGPAHQVDERTQTNWNGIVGTMELRATDPVWIRDVQVYPNAERQEARVRVVIGNSTGKPAAGTLTADCESTNVREPEEFPTQSVKIDTRGADTVVEFTYQPGKRVPLWQEFHAAMLEMTLQLETTASGSTFSDTRAITFGMRDFTAKGNLLQVNGTTVFLRGRLDCANYPLTGYAPMGNAEWRRIFGILRDWGLNHVRFHSWCPPRAAFEAADELGFYLQVELPNKRSAFNAADSREAARHNIDFLEAGNIDGRASLYDYGKREGELIMRHFGNHPSFVMFTLGNELGRNEGMFELVRHFREIDPRRLYAQGSNNNHWAPSLADGDDFWVTAKVATDRIVRGSFWIADSRLAHIESLPPSTLTDYQTAISGLPVPVISHEIGAFQVSPDFREIPKFTGVLRAKNYEIFRERLAKAGMSGQADGFVRASGALAAICYREDIEAALRTPGFGGFQLLDIMDFPGQGTAPVGMLNVFMESKGIIEPAKWREFCGETVPLLRMEKYTWTEDQTFTGRVQVAQYGPADLPDAVVRATLADAGGAVLSTTSLPATSLRQGGLNDVGNYSIALGSLGIEAPARVTLTLTIAGTGYRNSYPLWIYPGKVDNAPPAGVGLCRSFADPETREILAKGGKVLLLPELADLPHAVPGGFQTDYWSPMFAEAARKRGIELPPGTLGILCDPAHPALAAFPTAFHSNWQWWHLVKNSRPLILDEMPEGCLPIVQVIDNFARNHKLGLIFETRVGKGAMLVCAIDLPAIRNEPAARQLLHSLLRYVDSPAFAPEIELDHGFLERLLPRQQRGGNAN